LFLVTAPLLWHATRHITTGAARPSGASGYQILFADRPYLLLIVINTVFALCSVFLTLALPLSVVTLLPPDQRWVSGPVLMINTILLAGGAAVRVPVESVGCRCAPCCACPPNIAPGREQQQLS